MARFRFLLVLCLVSVLNLQGQTVNDHVITGDAAIAEKYVVWAKTAITDGRWSQALAGLERGTDFADNSSDIWYLLAFTRSHEKKSCGAVFQAVRLALEINQWRLYTPVLAKLLEAETLIQIRRYAEALHILSSLPQSVDAFCLRLLALKGLGDRERFSAVMAQVMDAYPRDPKPIRILFEYAVDQVPTVRDQQLISLALQRLSFLNRADPRLAYLSIPFIWDVEEARRLLGAYRAVNKIDLASLPAMLNLGVMSGNDAVEELFSSSAGGEKTLDKSLLIAVWNLLRTDEERNRFQEKILYFSGIITEDADKDGYIESRVRYREGTLIEYAYDRDQDELADLTIFFEAGMPVRAEVVLAPEAAGEVFAAPVKDTDRTKGIVHWEQYPAVLETEVGEVRYKPRPFEYFFFPIYFKKLESGGLLYPERDAQLAGISRRTLISSAAFIERPSREFSGAVEQIELDRGVPQKAREFFKGQLVSETDFHLGTPVIQRIDLDMNGYLETVRHFRKTGNHNLIDFENVIELSDSDWDENGFFEYREEYTTGSADFIQDILFSWDINRDGAREFFDKVLFKNK